MNASRHPSIDQIADLDAGVLPAAEASELSAHLDACTSCSEVMGELAEVKTLLADAGQTPVPVPSDVVLALDAALDRARAEDAAGVTSLAEHRTASTPAGSPTGSSPRRPGRLLLGAAAAVAVFAVGGAVVDQLGLLSGSQSDSTASVADQELGGSKAGSGPTENGNPGSDSAGQGSQSLRVPRTAAPTLYQANAAAYAAGLADAAVPVAKPPVDCTRDESLVAGARPSESFVTFDGKSAVLRLDRQHREFTVVACPGPDDVLYRSSY